MSSSSSRSASRHRVAVGHDHGRKPGLRDVGVREADEQARASAPSVLHLARARLHPVRASRRCPGASRAAASARCPTPSPACTLPAIARSRTAGAQAGLVDVDVRIGLVAGEHGRVVDHRRDRGWRACRAPRRSAARRERADAREQRAFAVVVALGDHRAVEVEQDGVAAAGRPPRRSVGMCS